MHASNQQSLLLDVSAAKEAAHGPAPSATADAPSSRLLLPTLQHSAEAQALKVGESINWSMSTCTAAFDYWMKEEANWIAGVGGRDRVK